jgi:hypothetical protein
MKALMPEIVEEEKPVREPRKARAGSGSSGGGGKRGKKQEETFEINETPKEPELTAMQIAWQMATDRAKTKDKGVKVKTAKSASSEQEGILNRTLEKRLPTGG